MDSARPCDLTCANETSIDAAGRLIDGTRVNDVTDLKCWLVANPDIFSPFIGEVADRGNRPQAERQKIVATIGEKLTTNDVWFRGRLLVLIDSDMFRTN